MKSPEPALEDAAERALMQKVRDLARDNWVLQCRLAETRHSLELARAEAARMLESRSWRATRPLRWVLDELRALRDPGGKTAAPALRSVGDFEPAIRRDGRVLMVDVTELAIENLQGGIQHTVKGILSEWLLFAPPGWRVVPVQLTREGVYVSASGDLKHLFGAFDDPHVGRRIELASGDVFLGLDLLRDHALPFREALTKLRSAHVRVEVVVYDLLPIDLAHCVPEHIHRSFASWLDVVGDLADGVICISNTVASRFSAWLVGRGGRNAGIAIRSFRLGVPEFSMKTRAPETSADHDGVRFLMVGTVEPRKGYVDALDAFDRIWSDPSANITLTIVGRYGWGLEQFLERLEHHPELGRRLRWLRHATDDEVHSCYQSSDGLLFCSYGEGFGLPIVEAAQHGLPMLLRDLPEFREVAGGGAFFFTGSGAAGVEQAVRRWLELRRIDAVPAPEPNIAITWERSASQLLASMGLTAVE